MNTERGSALGRTLMSVLASLVLLSLLAALPSTLTRYRDRAREAETKQNLHSIQLACERYSIDAADFSFPPWLSGGSQQNAYASGQPPVAGGDPLLGAGYLLAYPANPFGRGTGREARQLALVQQALHDPLRPDAEANVPGLLRFGLEHGLMGNLLGLTAPGFPEYTQDSYIDDARLPEGCRLDYPFWDAPARPGRHYWLQGQFFYWPRADGSRNEDGFANVESDELPVTGYSLGAFGSFRNKGQDLFTEDSLSLASDAAGNFFNQWTPVNNPALMQDERGDYRPTVAHLLQNGNYLRFNVDNGIPDNLIIVLDSGISRCKSGY